MKKRSRFVNSIIVGSIVLLGALLARVPQGLGAATAQTQQLGTSGALALAAELKVDINNSGRPVLEGNEPTYTPWSTNQSWFSGGDTASASFSGVTVTFTRKGSVGNGLQSGYWKLGVENSAYNVKLTSDDIKVSNGDNGAQIEMRISGLPAGSHSLLVYHNDWDNHAAGAVAPLTVSVNGSTVISSLPMTVRATNATQAASSYVTFTAVSGQDVVILFQSRNTATYNNVYINGFEIDTPNAILRATIRFQTTRMNTQTRTVDRSH